MTPGSRPATAVPINPVRAQNRTNSRTAVSVALTVMPECDRFGAAENRTDDVAHPSPTVAQIRRISRTTSRPTVTIRDMSLEVAIR
jgi:hypothetical protein